MNAQNIRNSANLRKILFPVSVSKKKKKEERKD